MTWPKEWVYTQDMKKTTFLKLIPTFMANGSKTNDKVKGPKRTVTDHFSKEPSSKDKRMETEN